MIRETFESVRDPAEFNNNVPDERQHHFGSDPRSNAITETSPPVAREIASAVRRVRGSPFRALRTVQAATSATCATVSVRVSVFLIQDESGGTLCSSTVMRR